MTVRDTLEMFRTIFNKVLIITLFSHFKQTQRTEKGVKFYIFTAIKTVTVAHLLEYGGSRFLRNDGNRI
jgi:hypothetical protein